MKNPSSNFGLIEETMDLARIFLAVQRSIKKKRKNAGARET